MTKNRVSGSDSEGQISADPYNPFAYRTRQLSPSAPMVHKLAKGVEVSDRGIDLSGDTFYLPFPIFG